MTLPRRRSPRDKTASNKLILGSCQERCAPARRKPCLSNSCLVASVSSASWADHWQGVWGLGTKVDTLTLILGDLFPACLPALRILVTSSTILLTSSRVSLGSPI